MSVNPETYLLQKNKSLLYQISKQDTPRIMTRIYEDSTLSFSQVNILIHLFQEHGLVTITKKGKVKFVEITSKGKEVTELLKKIERKIKVKQDE